MLKQRVMTALLMVALLLVALFGLPIEFTVALFAAVLLAGAWEWSALTGLVRRPARVAYLLVMAVVMAVTWQWLRLQPQQLPLLLQVTLLWWLAALVWLLFLPQSRSRSLSGLAGFFVLIPAWVSISYMLTVGATWVLYMLLVVVATDVGGYLIGGRFGRHKLAPRVSPGKTWEGVFGGLALALVVAIAGGMFFRQPMVEFLVVSLVTVMVSIVGDLTESLFKRHAGLKDSGTLLPGHGGVLDRLDSICAAAPVFLYGLAWLGVFAL